MDKITSKKEKKMVKFSAVSKDSEQREWENNPNQRLEHTSHTLAQERQPVPGEFGLAQVVRSLGSQGSPRLSAYSNRTLAEAKENKEEHNQVSALKSPSLVIPFWIAEKLLEISWSNLKEIPLSVCKY